MSEVFDAFEIRVIPLEVLLTLQLHVVSVMLFEVQFIHSLFLGL
jgi:hypothetical protein